MRKTQKHFIKVIIMEEFVKFIFLMFGLLLVAVSWLLFRGITFKKNEGVHEADKYGEKNDSLPLGA